MHHGANANFPQLVARSARDLIRTYSAGAKFVPLALSFARPSHNLLQFLTTLPYLPNTMQFASSFRKTESSVVHEVFL